MDITLTLRLDLSPALAAALDRIVTTIGRDLQAQLSAPEQAPVVPSAPIVQRAAVPPPKPVAPPAPAAAGKRWTEERIAILRDGYPRGVARRALLTALNACPGPDVSIEQLNVYARQTLGLRRPSQETPPAPQSRELATEPSPASRAAAAAVAVAENKDVLGEETADDATIRHWAAARGVCNGGEKLDLDRVNAKRTHLGLPPFARRNGLTASAATMRPGAPR